MDTAGSSTNITPRDNDDDDIRDVVSSEILLLTLALLSLLSIIALSSPWVEEQELTVDDDDGLWSSLGLIGAKAQCSIGLDDERGGGAENDDPQPNSSSSRHNHKVAVAPTTADG